MQPGRSQTTNIRPKSIALQDTIGNRLITIGGMAKGSGMIHPNMATMLAYFTTDASITRSALQQALTLAVNESFNCITVDGDTSTNDTVLCMSNGNTKIMIKQARLPFVDFCCSWRSAGHSRWPFVAMGRCHQGGEHW
jgi:glutamate N-acetyltransferase/amino-acid N-acetyltransferase